ncbi:E3 ubiquitin-protein ligase RHF1A-like [Primulina eburnea]|uniref:E3 ubiquitin-protein ligase RHF1A-like n=1 Tax=Primulina eburnea TaxID=1245227 RepID=UPI003C6BFD6A
MHQRSYLYPKLLIQTCEIRLDTPFQFSCLRTPGHGTYAVFVLEETRDDCICDDSVEDGCIICLEPFNSLDPPMVTKCKHEYHFQCILGWSQRSYECPICSQHLVLKDPASQELLGGVQSGRNLRHNFCCVDQDGDVNNEDSPQEDDLAFEQRIMRHFTAVASRARNISRRRRQTIPDMGHSQILPSVSIPNMSNKTRVNSSLEVNQNLASCFSNFDSAISIGAPTVTHQTSSLNIPSFGDSPSRTSENVHYSDKFSESPPNTPRRSSSSECVAFSESPPNTPRRSSSSEFVAFSESLKSKISNASTRYKESISTSSRVLKEKLIARKGFVKELSREVQRETSAGIARMIEHLDFSTKRNSKSPHEAKGDNSMVQSANQNIKGTVHDKIIDSSSINI